MKLTDPITAFGKEKNMNGLTRRQAFVGAIGLATIGTAFTYAEPADEEDNPIPDYGKDGDASSKMTQGRNALNPAALSNNCGQKKGEIESRFDVAHFGSCHHPTAVDADAVAYTTLLAQLANDGALFNHEVGHKTITNRTPIGNFNTYLSYAAGDHRP
jgi:hypothetical protein